MGDAGMSMITVSGVGVSFGDRTLLDGVTFQIERGERWGVVGRNGSGKTTLLNVVLGIQEPSRGSVSRQAGLRVRMMEQHRDMAAAGTVWEAASGPFAELLA